MAKRALFHSFHTPHFIQKSWLERGRPPFQLEEQVEEKIPPSVGACQPSKQPACWFPEASVNIRVSRPPTVVTQPGLALLWWWACPFHSSKGFLGVEGACADGREGFTASKEWSTLVFIRRDESKCSSYHRSLTGEVRKWSAWAFTLGGKGSTELFENPEGDRTWRSFSTYTLVIFTCRDDFWYFLYYLGALKSQIIH